MQTPTQARIESLDVLRGLALIGILVMNIQSFSMIETAYANPTSYGNLEGANYWVWFFSHLFADSKFMAIFSMLFGAGIILFCDNAEKKDIHPATIHYKRNFWLIVIGMIHAYFFWQGDILVGYALCAFVLYFVRKFKASTLFKMGIALLVVPPLIFYLLQVSFQYMPEDAYQDLQDWHPNPDKIAEEIAQYQVGFFQLIPFRASRTILAQTILFGIYTFWRAAGMMLLGMALYKWDFLTARKSNKLYIITALISASVGFPIILYGIQQHFAHNWSFEHSMFGGSNYNYLGSIFVAIFYSAMIQIMVKNQFFPWKRKILSSLGKLALTNYLGQTLICSFIFYGYGLGLFGKLERKEQILVVLGVVVFQIIFSLLWTKFFRFGPMEKLWRKLYLIK